jgi:TonB family protein
MNAEFAEPTTSAGQTQPPGGWSRPRWIIFLVLAMAAHLALVFAFGAKKTPPPRAVTNAPQFQLTQGASEITALTDPTLFARPHEAVDFVPALWRRPPPVQTPSFRWTEPPPYLVPAAETLGAAFNSFMQTNWMAMQALNFKPEAQFDDVASIIESAPAQHSAIRIAGSLSQRRLLNRITLPSMPRNDVLSPSKVQVLVDASGTVLSAVLLESSDWSVADQKALELSRAARFSPGSGTVFGEITFIWHTVPTKAP